MEIIKSIEQININGTSAVTLGKFDGMHRGHRRLAECVLKAAEERGCSSVLFTFEIPDYLTGGTVPVLMTKEERRIYAKNAGFDIVIECPLTGEIRGMDPEDFIEQVLVDRLHVSITAAGSDFRFGKDRAGNPAMLKEAGDRFGFDTVIKSLETDHGEEISSTLIKEQMLRGHMERVNELLGYNYSLSGEIVHGKTLGGRIGVPTVNIIPAPEKILPPYGVYASYVFLPTGKYKGVTNIGINPTVDDRSVRVETHLLDFNRDVYGQQVRIELLSFRRPEQNFGSVEALKEQLYRDIEERAKL